MLKKLRGMFSNDLSIDLGTANTLIYVRGQGIVLDEPSVVAIRVHNGQKTIEAVEIHKRAVICDVFYLATTHISWLDFFQKCSAFLYSLFLDKLAP